LLFAIAASTSAVARSQSQPRVIELTADHDSRYKIDGQTQPMITVKAREEIVLRVTARKAKGRNRDGSIHGFSLLLSMAGTCCSNLAPRNST